MKSYYPRFVCPQCRIEHLCEVRHQVERTLAAVSFPDPWDEQVYDLRFVHPVEPKRTTFRCGQCGHRLRDAKGGLVRGYIDLAVWLKVDAEERMAGTNFICPSCGGRQLDDTVAVDEEGYGYRIFCCHDCGKAVCDEEESVLMKILESGQKVLG